VIDLHMHTTASDGRCSPADLVARVHAAGVTTFAVTDHDTVAALAEARVHADRLGLTLVPGLEATAVWQGRDVHVLGYWIDPAHPPLMAFLAAQRERRVARVRAIGAALTQAGAAVDLEPLLAQVSARAGAAVGRPGVAQALVAAGHASSVQDAFDRLLGEGCPAYVARTGVPPEAVCAVIHAAGGVASLAHPGVTRRDDCLEDWAQGALDALEAYHSDHSEAEQTLYLERARQLGLAVSGGSDFHGDDPMSHRSRRRAIGGVSLPESAWHALLARVPPRHGHGGPGWRV
jgi:predicted metal-dependent phosphoesterase TrpH